ncbi:MAG TPA: ABC transporter substrate-binding protein [Clostridia bacterium]|nr:ABC transporter substrate-binding protein [Clostridia bacterium]
MRSRRSSFPSRTALIALTSLLALALAACGDGEGTTGPGASGEPDPSGPVVTGPGPTEPGTTPDGSIEPVDLVVGLGYIPSVQFAPFYYAEQEGYYAEAGLTVEFQNRIDPDLITLVGQGDIDIGLGDGTSVIPAVSQGIPVRYIATVYGKFPSIVFAKESSGIRTVADLAGRKIGTPGRYGTGWVMLQAMFESAGLTEEDVEVIEYPDFGQGAAVEQGAVDAATGFANNEPVVLELSGTPATVLRVDDIVALPGPGIIAGVGVLEDHPDAVQAFVSASLRAMEEIAANPELGLDAALRAVPELAGDRERQRAILAATIDTWRGPVQEERGLGAVDRDGWVASIEFLEEMGLVPEPITIDDLLRDDLLPAGD